MQARLLEVALAVLTVAFLISNTAAQNVEFKIAENERIVFIGSEFVEQQIKHNYFEHELIEKWPKVNFEFRNLGWSGDNPTGIARGYFGGAKEGFQRLTDELKRLKPTKIIACYGANSTPAEFKASLPEFVELIKAHSNEAILLSHPPAEQLPGKSADVTKTNQTRKANATHLREFIESLGPDSNVRFVDLYEQTRSKWQLINGMKDSQPTDVFTHDGLRYNTLGYQSISNVLGVGLGLHNEFAKTDFDLELLELLRKKNELYFHRYRPQNETYLRGFRKHEQGQNAVEIQQFDRLIEEAEKRIRAHVRGEALPAQTPQPEPVELSFTAATPDEELRTFKLAEGLEVSLFAAEPMVANPIHMNFDSAGRLWVATSPIYPQILPGAEPTDQIVVLEDTDNDGKADKKTIFADDLLIPTAVLPDNRGGAYVANSTELIHLSDTDGNGVADHRRVVLAGFGTEDTHHILHTFRWGPDASIYFNQSIYIHTHMETPFGPKRLMGSGIWRFNPERGHANILMRGLVNPWGHIFDDFGQSFATDGAGGNGINYAFPGSAYVSAVGYSKIIRGMNPGQPKLCGLEIITDSHFPESWTNLLVTNDFRGNRINRFQLTESGSGYASKQLSDLMSSSHRAFRPVDLKMAPDGSLMVADWYNPIINHGEVDFRDSRRDYKHGRIWRIKSQKRELSQPIELSQQSNSQLVGLLKSESQFLRTHSKVELKNRINSGVSEFDSALNEQLQNLIHSENPQHQLEAAWTLVALEQMQPEILKSLLSSEDHRVRSAAIRIAANQLQNREDYAKVIKPFAQDKHPRVRLEFINAWRELFAPEDFVVLSEVLAQPMDTNIEFALGYALKQTSKAWLSQLPTSQVASDLQKLDYIFNNVTDSPLTSFILEKIPTALEANDIPTANRWLGLVCERGNDSQLTAVFDLLEAEPQLVSSGGLGVFLAACKKRRVRLDIAPARVEPLMRTPAGIELVGQFKLTQLKSSVVELLGSKATNKKLAAIRAIARFGDADRLIKLSGSESELLVRRVAIEELLALRPNRAVTLALKLFRDASNQQKLSEAQQLFSSIVRRRNLIQPLTKSINESGIPATLVDSFAQRAGQLGRSGTQLVKAIKSGQQAKMAPLKTPEQIAQLIEEVQKSGDAAKGESIYRRQELGCIKCHAIGGAGGVVGPDMISLGASSPIDYIIESLLDPNAKIKEGYHTTTVLTFEGIQINGKLMSQADGNLILRDADNKEIVIPEEDIDEQKISPISLMPADLTANLTRGEFTDLVAFLSSLGKEGDFKVAPTPFVRRWIRDDGSEATTKVNGVLPVSDITTKHVSFELEVTTAGSIGIHVENPNGLRITLNEMTDNLRAEKIVKDLPVGKHVFKFAVMNKANRSGLRVKLFEVEGSAGKAIPINQ